MGKLKNKIAVITGSGRGIGRATAELFAKEGCKVVAVSRTEKELKELEEKTKNYQGKIYPFKADITLKEEVDKIFDYVENKFKRLDILINNAGITYPGSIFDMDPDKFLYCLKLNIWSAFLCTQRAVRIMAKEGKGKIINVGSVCSHWAGYGSAGHYIASKYGLKGFTEAVMREMQDKGLNISVGMVCPGIVDTTLTNPKGEIRENWLKPETIAEAIFFAVTNPENVNVYDIIIFPNWQKVW
ncbi:MAG: SDR family oxidoreductase [Candidatus Omnitrophica bacterium]|nr:SDR family oxidoreductase [Candidatus Omnitrophota bacterium]